MPDSYAHDGSSWRKLKQWYVHDGSAWRKLKTAYCHDGTAWRKVFASSSWVKLGTNTVSTPGRIVVHSGSLYCSDGLNVYIWNGSSWSSIGQGGQGGSVDQLLSHSSGLYARVYNGNVYRYLSGTSWTQSIIGSFVRVSASSSYVYALNTSGSVYRRDGDYLSTYITNGIYDLPSSLPLDTNVYLQGSSSMSAWNGNSVQFYTNNLVPLYRNNMASTGFGHYWASSGGLFRKGTSSWQIVNNSPLYVASICPGPSNILALELATGTVKQLVDTSSTWTTYADSLPPVTTPHTVFYTGSTLYIASTEGVYQYVP